MHDIKFTKRLKIGIAIFILLLINMFLAAQEPATLSDYDLALIWYDSALTSDGNFVTQVEYAKKAAEYANKAETEDLQLKAQLLLLKAAYYTTDTTIFFSTFKEAEQIAQRLGDTAAFTKMYLAQGTFYFTIGNSQKGIESLKKIEQNKWYNENSLEDYISTLGALADLNLDFERNIDSALYFTNRLLTIAEEFKEPSAFMVGNTKMARIYSKAYNFNESIKYLRKVYNHVDQVENKGYLLYYYRKLINSFIEVNQVDSAQYYMEVCKSTADFETSDPRHCSFAILEAQINLALGKLDHLPNDFQKCYDYLKNKRSSVTTASAMIVIAEFYLLQGELDKAKKEIESIIQYSTAANYTLILLKAYEILSRIHQEAGNSDEALKAYKLHKIYVDTINTVVFKEAEKLLATQQALSNQTRENILLKGENERASLVIKQRNNIIVSFSLILLLTLFVIYLLRRLLIERKKLNQQLESRVKERTQSLENSNKALIEANEKLSISNTELERFAFIASHDLKEPVRNILNFSELLKRKIGEEDQQAQNYLGFILQGANSMHNLIEDVLKLSMIRKEENVFQKIDLKSIIEEVIYSIQNLIDTKAGIIKYPPLPEIIGDKSQCVIIFHNLIINGLKYNQSKPPIIDIDYQENANYHLLSVSDNGIGIEPKYQDQVFELFKRLHSKSEYEGTGIGLSIVKKMVEQHQGQIWLESTPGNGTKFTFSISKSLIKSPGNNFLPKNQLISSKF